MFSAIQILIQLLSQDFFRLLKGQDLGRQTENFLLGFRIINNLNAKISLIIEKCSVNTIALAYSRSAARVLILLIKST